MSFVGERPRWTIQSPHKGRKKKAKGYEEREIRSSLLILDLKDGKLEEGKTFHKLHVPGMNDHLWEKVCGLGSETWKGCK